jgi:hypothetical protein
VLTGTGGRINCLSDGLFGNLWSLIGNNGDLFGMITCLFGKNGDLFGMIRSLFGYTHLSPIKK